MTGAAALRIAGIVSERVGALGFAQDRSGSLGIAARRIAAGIPAAPAGPFYAGSEPQRPHHTPPGFS
jgi:hypothetical protein